MSPHRPMSRGSTPVGAEGVDVTVTDVPSNTIDAVPTEDFEVSVASAGGTALGDHDADSEDPPTGTGSVAREMHELGIEAYGTRAVTIMVRDNPITARPELPLFVASSAVLRENVRRGLSLDDAPSAYRSCAFRL